MTGWLNHLWRSGWGFPAVLLLIVASVGANSWFTFAATVSSVLLLMVAGLFYKNRRAVRQGARRGELAASETLRRATSSRLRLRSMDATRPIVGVALAGTARGAYVGVVVLRCEPELIGRLDVFPPSMRARSRISSKTMSIDGLERELEIAGVGLLPQTSFANELWRERFGRPHSHDRSQH
jgi:hypothetical protein